MADRGVIIKVAAAAHLAIAAIYGVHVPAEEYLPRAIDRPLSIYGHFTGARARFDFFAPAVPSEARVEFLVVAADGGSRRVRLAATPSEEANRRLRLMYTIYGYPSERARLMNAWGEYMLRLDPQAVEVQTRIEVFDVPSLQESAAGMQGSWKEVGRATVRRGGTPGS